MRAMARLDPSLGHLLIDLMAETASRKAMDVGLYQVRIWKAQVSVASLLREMVS